MAIIKVFCGQCGQRVSGDESFYGTLHQCPVCSADILFPNAPDQAPLEPQPPAAPLSAALPPATAPSFQVPLPPSPAAHAPELSLPRAFDDQPSPAPPAAQTATATATTTSTALPESPAPAPPAPAPAAPAPPREADSMPFFVLVAGIGALVPCLNIIAAPVAIILGQLTLMRLDEDTPAGDRNKVIVGTTLGYVSLLGILLLAIVWKLKGPSIQALFQSH